MAATPYPLPRETRESTVLVGNGTAGPYGPSGYKVFDVVDVEVWTKPQGAAAFSKLSAGFTIAKTAALDFDTFSVTFATAVPATTSWFHRAARVAEREAAVTRGGSIDGVQLEKQLTKTSSENSELRRDIGRAWRSTVPGSGGGSIDAAGAAGDAMVSDGAGNIVGGLNLPVLNAAVQAEIEARIAAIVNEAFLREAGDKALASLIGGNYQPLERPDYDSRTALSLATVGVRRTAGRTGGYGAAGDGGAALYRRAVSEPSHAGKVRSADGAWWEVAEPVLTPAMLGAAANGATDDAAAIQATHDAANALGVRWQLCPQHRINSTVTISAGGLQGAVGQTRVTCGITNGTPVFAFTSPGSIKVADVAITASGFDFAKYLIDAWPAMNATGFKFGTPSVFTNRLHLQNIRSNGLAVSLDIRGFIITADNVWANACDLGFKGDTINSADLNLRLENCKKSFEIFGSTGAVLFRQLIDEGGKINTLPATIDGCSAVTFETPYWEVTPAAQRSTPFLLVGGTTECQQVRIRNVRVALYADGGVPALSFDKVDGLEVTGRGSASTFRKIIGTTANTKNFRVLDLATPSTPWLSDGSRNVGTAWNYFANRTFDVWLRGWANVAPSNATISQETSVVRRGRFAPKLTAVNGQAFNNNQWIIEGEPVVALRGKTIRFGAWVYVPAIAEYPNDNTRTRLPGILVQSYNGSVTVNSPTRNTLAVAGDWNFMFNEVTVQEDATRIYAVIYVNHSAVLANGAEYLVPGELTICETIVPLSRQMAGDLIDHPSLPKFVGGRMQAFGTAVPTDVDQTYEVGDIIWKSNVAAAGSPGWICTTAGVGGTAVWKAFANVAA